MQNIFSTAPNPPDPFTIKFGGIIFVPNGPGFGTRDMKFVFYNTNQINIHLPTFESGTFIYDARQWELANSLPFQVSRAELTIKNGALPPEQLFRPDNLEMLISARLEIPPDEPVFKGAVNDLKVTFDSDGTPHLSISSIRLGLDAGTALSPFTDIEGDLFIGGLNNMPPNPFFIGLVGGTYQTYKLKLLLAFSPLNGLIGVCLDANLGAAGIPLGQTGFLITGARGGYSFGNRFLDPCDFSSYFDPVTGKPIELPGQGIPQIKMDWTTLRDYLRRATERAQAFNPTIPSRPLVRTSIQPAQQSNRSAGPTTSVNEFGIPCPDGCPPATVNLFCQPHPRQDKPQFAGSVILKFSSIDEPTLNNVFGITQERIEQLLGQGIDLAVAISQTIRQKLQNTLPVADPNIVGQTVADRLNYYVLENLNAVESGIYKTLTNALDVLEPEQKTAAILYPLIRDLVEIGLPCPDITVMAGGVLSYVGISAFANVQGDVIIGTPGSAGVVGTVNVLGVPFGRAKIFVSATDTAGNPNPSACGDVNVAIGPLELGQLRAQILCDGCVTEMLSAFGRFIIGLSRETIDHLLNKVAPQYVGRNPQDLPLLLNDQQKMAFLSELAQLPPNLLPPNLKQMFVNALDEAWNTLNPEIRLCGEVKPKIFGISIGNELMGVSGHVTKTNIIFVYGYSPAALMAEILGRTVVGYGAAYALSAFSLFTQEKGQAAYAVYWPDAAAPALAALDGKLRDPQSIINFLDETFDFVIQNSVMTCEYRLSPMGLKAFDWQERYIMPNLTSHPAFRTNWVRPENRMPPLPSRMDLIISALTNHLPGTTAGLISDPNWKGRKNDLYLAFPEGTSESDAVKNCSFADDYFPHGGILGGSILGVPRALYDPVPEVLFKALDPNNSPLERILSALSYIQEFLLTMRTAGAFCYYIPAPNPPTLVNTNTTPPSPLTPRELFKSIMEFDFDNIRPGNPYPSGEMFITGWFDGRLLGVPFGRARLEVVPPDIELNQPAFFRATAEIPQNEWISLFCEGGQLVFDITQCPVHTIETTFTLLLQDLNNTLAANPNNETALRLAAEKVVAAISNDLPKIKLEASLNNFHFPQVLQPILDANGAFALVAYSPGYNPYFDPEDSSPFARAKRHGGIAFKGNTKFRAGPVTFWEGESQFWVLPKSSGLPELSARLNAPVMPISELITLRNVLLEFSTEPNPHFIASGKMDSFALGTFEFMNDNASDLEGELKVSIDDSGNPSVNLQIKPAQLLLDYYGNRLLVHGSTRNDPFTFNTAGPWSASIEFTNDINLLNIVEVGFGGFISPITLAGNGVSSAAFTIGLAPSAGFTVFPNNPNLKRVFTIQTGATGSLMLNSQGQFLLQAKMNSGEIGGFSIPAGASLTASNGGVAILWQAGTSTASIQIPADGGTPVFSGQTEIPPIDLIFLRLEGINGGNLKGGFDNNGFAVESGARLTIKSPWGMDRSIALNNFTISNNGAILINASGLNNDIALAGYPFVISDFVFRRNPTNGGDGGASLAFHGNFQANAQNIGFPNAPFSGLITNGNLKIEGGAENTAFFGFPVRAFTNKLAVSASDFTANFYVGFCLGDNIGAWTALGTNYMSGSFSANSSANLTMQVSSLTLNKWQLNNIVGNLKISGGESPEVYLEGDVQLQGFPSIRLGGRFGPDFLYTLLPAPRPGASIPSFAVFPQLDTDVKFQLNRDGFSASGKLHLPLFPEISLNGYFTNINDFALEGRLDNILLGYNLNNGRIVLERIGNNPITLILTNCNLSVPGLTGANAATVSGNINNNGTFRFTGNLNAPKFAALSIPGLSGNASVVFTQQGLELSGQIDASDGVLSKVSYEGSLDAKVGITANGIKTLNAVLNIVPTTNNLFSVYPATGSRFIATLDNNGLHLPQARLAFGSDGYEFANLPLPELVLDYSGNFIVYVGQDNPLELAWRGFNFGQVNFRLQRIEQVIGIPNFNGKINIPHLGRLVDVSGFLNNDGTFELIGTTANSIDLASLGITLPVRNISANANVKFNNSGLKITGNLSGGLLENLSGGSASGSLEITKDAVTISGNITLNPIVLSAISISSTSGDGSFTASLNNNGLSLPNGLQLKYNNNVLVSLPSFNIDLNGGFQITKPDCNFTISGFGITGAKINLSRANTITTLQITDANISIPGFTTALNVKLNGHLNNDGTFLLETSAPLTGAFKPSDNSLPFSNLGGEIRVSLNPIGAIVSGDLSGGALEWLNSQSFSINGTLKISSSGVITPSAIFTLPELQLPPGSSTGFRLTPMSGNSFQITLGANGISFPAGAQMFYRGQSLGAFMLPPFNINKAGDFSITISSTDFSLDGFNLKGALTLTRTNGVTILNVLSGNTLWLPGINSSVNLSGVVRTDNTFDISGTLSGDITVSGLPVTQIKSGADVEFRRFSGNTILKLNGTLGGGVLSGAQPSDIQLLNATGAVVVASSGTLSLSGSVAVRPFTVGCFTIEGNYATNGGPISATWSSQSLNLSGARLRILSGNVFDINFPLQPISIPLNGEFSVNPVQQLTSKIKGFPFKNVGFTLIRLSPNSAGLRDIRLSGLSGTLDFLNTSELNKFLQSGTVLSDGSLDVNWNGSTTLGSFGGTEAYLRLNNNVLTVGGKIDIRVLGRQLAVIPFEGTTDVNGNYSLSPKAGVNWVLNQLIGSDSGNNLFNTLGRAGGGLLTLTKSGISGSDKLVYGNLQVPINISGLTANGISFNGTYNYKNFVRFLDALDPPPAPCTFPPSPPAPSAENADVYGELDVTVSINADNSNGSFSVRYSGKFGWWVVTDSLDTT